jgi:hypothetical protein
MISVQSVGYFPTTTNLVPYGRVCQARFYNNLITAVGWLFHLIPLAAQRKRGRAEALPHDPPFLRDSRHLLELTCTLRITFVVNP